MLRAERDGEVLVWTLDRPAAKNALSIEMLESIRDSARAARNEEDIRALVIRGAGGTFASGGDLRELRDRSSPQDAAAFSDLGFDACEAVAMLPFPTIAVITGVAFGGGAELAIACDMRIAEQSAKVSFKQVRLGTTTSWGSAHRLLDLVGPSTASRLLFTAHELTSAEARVAGVVDFVAETGAGYATAMAWAADIIAGSPTAIAEMKKVLATEGRTARRAAERASFIATWSSPDHIDAVAAYFERRPPTWKPRQ